MSDAGDLYVVIEVFAGRPLAEVRAAASGGSDALPLWFALHVTAKIGQALNDASRQTGVVHREIGPHCILLSTEQVLISAFI